MNLQLCSRDLMNPKQEKPYIKAYYSLKRVRVKFKRRHIIFKEINNQPRFLIRNNTNQETRAQLLTAEKKKM